MDTQTTRMMQVAKARAQLEEAQKTMQRQQQHLDALQRKTNIMGAKTKMRSTVFMGAGRARVHGKGDASDAVLNEPATAMTAC